MSEESPNSSTSIYIMLFILVIITAMALYDEGQKINRLKSAIYIISNRLDSLITEEHEKKWKIN